MSAMASQEPYVGTGSMICFLLGYFFLFSACCSCHYIPEHSMCGVPFLTLGSVYVGQASLILHARSSVFSGFFAYLWVIVWAD